ncbi:tetratricopeptide repeat protein 12 [Genypterus blacodes]|uniref:tetratricopeptide repeat protein 12 n=1 Tax=Genypterus blacodes TaxID=154954 RepID=UPI003F76FF80
MDNSEDFESFLKNVDTISGLVKDLNSTDEEVNQRAIERADRYMATLEEPCRTKINKTRINTNPPKPPPPVQTGGELQQHPGSQCPRNAPSISPENFMKSMERDAEERRKRRVAKEKIATTLKEKGNEAYAQEDYESAVKHYSDGLAALKDMQPLYTNRAQAYIKLGKYREAITDCEWALKCNEKCLKAYLHMGKALLALKNYEKSRSCFEKMVEIEPGKEKLAKEYLTQVGLEEERENQERSAMEEFVRGEVKAATVPELLEKLSRPMLKPFYYRGGLELLSRAVTDCTGQTLFRLNNGFSIISSNDTMRRCLLQKTNDQHSQELCVSVLQLWRIICDGNDENQKTLMACPVSTQAIVLSAASGQVAVRSESLALLRLYSQMPHSRGLAMNNLDLHMLMKNLMACISQPKHPHQQQEATAVIILEKFAAENKFCFQLRDVLTDSVSAPFATMLRNISSCNLHILPSVISIVGCLAKDDVIRHNLAHDPECWKAFLLAIKQCGASQYTDILYPLLGLIVNLSTVTSPVIQEVAVSLCGCCLDLLKYHSGGVITRAAGVLSGVLPQSPDAIQHVIGQDVVKSMCRLLKGRGETATKYAIKTLTVCAADSPLVRDQLVKSNKNLSILRRLLAPGSDEMVAGNAALCLSLCIELEGIASNLLGTDIVLLLLRHAAGDAKRTAVQRNAAVALGKLCRSEPRHIDKLRQLHGLEILHSCMKLIT